MTENPTKFSLKDFIDLDHSSSIEFLINSMEIHYHLDSMKLIKQRALKILGLKLSDNVIELGCGLGHDAESIASIVGKTGSVVAVDTSNRMIQEAKNNSIHSNVHYCHGNANHLNFADNSFSACRVERLLVSQSNINQVLSEAIRVIKPSGKICITDLDFGTIILSPYIEDVTDLVVKHWQNLVLNPFIGRKLAALFKQHGLINIQMQPEVFTVESYETLKQIVQFETMLEDMVALNQITEEQKSRTVSALEKAHNENEFFWSINLFTVVGQKSSG